MKETVMYLLRRIVVIAVVVTASGSADGQTCTPTPPTLHIGDPPGDGVITFGIANPINLRGENDGCGEPMPVGIVMTEALVWAINNARDIHRSDGLRIGVYAYNGCASPTVAAGAAVDYLTKRSQAGNKEFWPGIMGEVWSAASLAIAEVIRNNPVINQISMSFADELADYELFTRSFVRVGRVAKEAVLLMKKVMPQAKSVTIITGSDAAMRSASATALKEANAAGLCVSAFIVAESQSSDFSQAVDQALAQDENGVNAVIVFLTPTDQPTLINEIQSRIDSGDERAKKLVIFDAISIDALPRNSENLFSLRESFDLPTGFERYLTDMSEPLLATTRSKFGCNTREVSCRQTLLETARSFGSLVDNRIIEVEVMMRGITSAMTEKCGSLRFCKAFTSLTATEFSTYMRSQSFSKLIYAQGFQLDFLEEFENREKKEMYYEVWQNKRSGDVKIGEVHDEVIDIPGLEALEDPTSTCIKPCTCLKEDILTGSTGTSIDPRVGQCFIQEPPMNNSPSATSIRQRYRPTLRNRNRSRGTRRRGRQPTRQRAGGRQGRSRNNRARRLNNNRRRLQANPRLINNIMRRKGF